MKYTPQKILSALEVAKDSQIDGAHHKAWVIDQMVRKLCGTDKVYEAWIAAYKTGPDGPETYNWDIGIAP